VSSYLRFAGSAGSPGVGPGEAGGGPVESGSPCSEPAGSSEPAGPGSTSPGTAGVEPTDPDPGPADPGPADAGSPGSVAAGLAGRPGALTTKMRAVAMAATTSGARSLGMRSDATFLAGGGEPGRVLEDLDDLGGWQQDDRPAPAGALGVGGQHLDAVAWPEALGHVSRVDLDRQLDQVGVAAGGEHDRRRDERLAPDRGAEHSPGQLEVGARPQVVPQSRGRQADPEDDEVLAPQGRARRQVAGGRVHRDQPLRAVEEQRPGQDGEQDEASAERGAAVSPCGRAQAVGRGRRWRLGVQVGQRGRSVGDGAASAEDA
jgi:hypothetical protein